MSLLSTSTTVAAAKAAGAAPSIPVIDVSPLLGPALLNKEAEEARLRRSEELCLAAAEVGLFYVANHGIDEEVLRRARDYSRAFFALPLSAKEELSVRHSPSRRGYQRVGENATEGAADQHEALDFYRDMPVRPGAPPPVPPTNHGVNQWPQCPADCRAADGGGGGGGGSGSGEQLRRGLEGFRAFFEEEYVPAMLRLGQDLMRALALGLALPSAHHLDRHFDESFWVMRLIRYPAVDRASASVLGCGRHTDYGCLTVVNQDPDPRHAHCLEALCLAAAAAEGGAGTGGAKDGAGWSRQRKGGAPSRSEEEEGTAAAAPPATPESPSEVGSSSEESEAGAVWVAVPPVEGALAVNIGDMLALWTRDRVIRGGGGKGGPGRQFRGFRATPHRVHSPYKQQQGRAHDGGGCGDDDGCRISVPFFFEPNYDALIVPLPPNSTPKDAIGTPPERAVRYGDHLLQKTSTNFPGIDSTGFLKSKS